MNAIQKQFGPFAKECPRSWGMTHVNTCDAGGRCDMVKESSDPEWLVAVVNDPTVQKSVRAAAQRRLKQMVKSIN